ncbi:MULTISPECIES: DUF58 domain-containing protein [Flammeovirga]|uniref:DUF58 domain-containing protein n=1 Tax=Flammeovirga aprica JL-4 TaxID=694437 RepID=A0A7X9RY72_9BACT|nr:MULTISPECIES: DUF58 domain-containing protein [Flammeovirga]KXX68751.1 hypothetical protein AVL50_18945 [Flammeovirga sp. SJP92]MBD0402991.1 DUF58 domain-containing protein [Flammeovirga sp. EKP202]NME70850.1 DUF58 domain-containing protein [Flammeovirga aprica JL-4]
MLQEISFDTIRQYGNIELLAKQMVEGFITGLHKSPYHGFSVEFAEHNLYNPGESTRHIDWKVYARTDKLFTKRYEEETNLRAMIVLDRSPSMYYPDKTFDKMAFSTMAAASLGYMLQKQRDAVGLCTFSDDLEEMTQVKSTRTHLHQIFVKLQQMLEKPPPQKGTHIAKVLHQVAETIHKRSLVIIFSDMMGQMGNRDEMFAALQHLKHNNHEVLLFHVADHSTELQLEFPERPMVFVDVESGQKEKLRPSQVREQYQQTIQQLYHDLNVKCGQYKIDYVEVDSKKDIDQIIIPYMLKRQRMR